MKVQRLRVTFARDEAMKYISHLDVMRLWERALRRANIPVAYSEGFSPHPQLSLAAPLAVGMTSDAELMDVFLSEALQPREFVRRLTEQTPSGFKVTAAQEVGLGLPALQADMRFAEYEVDVASPGEHAQCRSAAEAAVDRFMAADSIPWEHQRENETRTYDIRAQVITLGVAAASDNAVTLTMRLKHDNSGSGRPEQVAAALGVGTPTRIHRTRLILADQSKALQAWRRSGRPEA